MNRREALEGIAGGLGLAAVDLFASRQSVVAQGTLPTELPPYMQYFSPSAESLVYEQDGVKVICRLNAGQILVAQAQRLQILGNWYDIHADQNPGRAYVFAIGASDSFDLIMKLGIGQSTWKAVEYTPRKYPGIIEDIVTAGKVQVTRAQIPGNCTPNGCSEVRLIAALGVVSNGQLQRFDLLSNPDEVITK